MAFFFFFEERERERERGKGRDREGEIERGREGGREGGEALAVGACSSLLELGNERDEKGKIRVN